MYKNKKVKFKSPILRMNTDTFEIDINEYGTIFHEYLGYHQTQYNCVLIHLEYGGMACIAVNKFEEMIEFVSPDYLAITNSVVKP